MDYYKNIKPGLDFKYAEGYLDFFFVFCENFRSIVDENFDINKFGDQSRYFVGNHKPFYQYNTQTAQFHPAYLVKSSKSLKILIELPYMVILFYNLFPEKVSKKIRDNLEKLVLVIKFLNNTYIMEGSQLDAKRKLQQISIYEDYLYSITKILYLFAYILKIQGFEVILMPFSKDCVNAIKFVLENIPKDNFLVRKDILGITKNMIKPFVDVSKLLI